MIKRIIGCLLISLIICFTMNYMGLNNNHYRLKSQSQHLWEISEKQSKIIEQLMILNNPKSYKRGN